MAAAGAGTRIQPLAFSKELLPVGSRFDGQTERPRAVTEYIIDRMARAGATNICFVISPGKSDILSYFGAGIDGINFAYVVQPRPAGLCDALFRALPLIPPGDHAVFGLPEKIITRPGTAASGRSPRRFLSSSVAMVAPRVFVFR